jgi:hypothetical protein
VKPSTQRIRNWRNLQLVEGGLLEVETDMASAQRLAPGHCIKFAPLIFCYCQCIASLKISG